MKKTLLALAVVAAAGSVNAAELMNTGNVSVTTDADFEVALKYGPFADNPEISYDGAEIGFAAESVINDNWTAFLKYGMEMSYGENLTYNYDDEGVTKEGSKSVVTATDIVAGFKFYQNHMIEFGQTSHVLDLGNSQHKDIGLDISNDELPAVEDLIVYEFTGEQIGFGASVELSGIEGKDRTGYAVYLDGSVGNFNLRGDFGMGTDGKGADETEATIYGIKGDYTADVFSVGLAYTGTSKDDADASLIDAWVGFSAGLDWYLGTQYLSTDNVDSYSVYLNTTYALNDVVGVYAEIGMADIEVDDGFGGSVGMTMSF
jgi:outer membrane protein OmpT